jgi:hypothetical protein
MANAMNTLGKVLREADTFDCQHALYLPFADVWNASTPCAVLDTEEGEESDDASRFVKERGLGYALEISSVQDIVANAREQKPGVDISDLVKAFLFYYDHDAFIVLPSS